MGLGRRIKIQRKAETSNLINQVKMLSCIHPKDCMLLLGAGIYPRPKAALFFS
jgi:hypothetical protein